jgi:hypothetical protein
MTTNEATSLWDLETRSFVRVPGLFRKWEIEQVVEPGSDLHVEAAGEAEDGTPLYVIYKRTAPDQTSGS